MNSFELEIWDDECKKTTFYTIKKEGEDLSETDKFFDKYGDENHPFHQQASELAVLIFEAIGDKYGAINDFITRTKNRAQSLPPKPSSSLFEIKELGINFPLRLYCYRVNEEILILFNGGIKDKHSDQKSKDISFKFQEVQTFVKKIEEALREEMIVFNPKKQILEDFQGNTEIIL